jgi:hypothetical protein
MRAVFISYRRDDSEGQSGRLYDDLVHRFGDGAVFMDVVGIEAGRDFRKVIDKNVASCGVLLAVIGPSWLDAKDETGLRRLDNPMDFVRLETAAALKRDIPVVPVLVRGARMPRPEQLPDDLKELAYRNGLELTHARWDSDVEVLIKALQPHLDLADESQPADVKVGNTAVPSPDAGKPAPARKPAPPGAPPGKPSPKSRLKSRLIVGAVAGAIIVAAIVGARIYLSNQKVPSKSSSEQGHIGPVQPIIKVFSATPTEVTKGGEIRLHWEVADADDVRLEPFGMVDATGGVTDQPEKTTVYKLTATNRGGGKAGSVQEVIVREPQKPSVAENQPPARSDKPTGTAQAIPNFAGTWQVTEITVNGKAIPVQNHEPLTISQNGAVVRFGSSGKTIAIDSGGKLTEKIFLALDQSHHNSPLVATEAEADLVKTFTYRLDGTVLVSEAIFDYRHRSGKYEAGTQIVSVWKYRRVEPNSR